MTLLLQIVEWSLLLSQCSRYQRLGESALAFENQIDPNWWELETDWAWLPENLRMTLVNGNN